MRKLIGTLETIGNVPITDKPKLILKNRYGWPMSDVDDGDIAPRETTLELSVSGGFEVFVQCTERFQDGRYYQLEFPKAANISPIRLFIPDGLGDIDFLDCIAPFVPSVMDRFFAGATPSLEFITALDGYMAGIIPSDEQIKRACDAFFDYADIEPLKTHPYYEAIDKKLYETTETP